MQVRSELEAIYKDMDSLEEWVNKVSLWGASINQVLGPFVKKMLSAKGEKAGRTDSVIALIKELGCNKEAI